MTLSFHSHLNQCPPNFSQITGKWFPVEAFKVAFFLSPVCSLYCCFCLLFCLLYLLTFNFASVSLSPEIAFATFLTFYIYHFSQNALQHLKLPYNLYANRSLISILVLSSPLYHKLSTSYRCFNILPSSDN